ncbi:MAG: L-threonine 3-dehydrogenase [Robiginitomaculum sp.]|nr:MAG: L-threonine 3-dehydrogenase [Robiginitomaculum sp.]
MKALVKAKPEPGIWMQDMPVPKPKHDEVLIKIKKTAICGTDIHIYNWDQWSQENVPVPLITGHEFMGEIVELGQHVTRHHVGLRVSGEGHVVGDLSRAAREGKWHLSADTKGIGVNRDGAFAEYLALPAFNVVPLPPHVSDDVAAILDPLGNATHAALTFDLVGEDVLITGAGPIGAMAGAIARHAGARHVVITDINQTRLDLAANLADVRTVNVAKEDLADVMAELGMTEGFDVGLEMSGAEAAFTQMTDTMVMGGKIAMLGIPPGETQVNWGTIITKALTIQAIYGRRMFETWYKMLAMLGSGLNVDGIITDHFAVDDFQAGFDRMRSGESGKVILEW